MPAALQTISPAAGIGLRAPHTRDMRARRPRLAFIEVHSENYFGAGGPPHHALEDLRRDYPLSLHGVGLSLGSDDPLDSAYLDRLRLLIARYEPALVSDHLCWTSAGGVHVHDLLPVPFTRAMVHRFAARIRQVQDALGRQLLVENLSSYVRFAASEMPEWEFVREIAAEADCKLLLDVNNVYVNAVNHGFDARAYLDALPADRIAEIHLAGYDTDAALGCLVDTHGQPVHEPVWALYRHAVQRIGPRPTLVEWDAELPALDVLLGEAAFADAILETHHVLAA